MLLRMGVCEGGVMSDLLKQVRRARKGELTSCELVKRLRDPIGTEAIADKLEAADRIEELEKQLQRQLDIYAIACEDRLELRKTIREVEKYTAWVESTEVGKSMSIMETKLRLADEALAEIQEKLADNEVALDIQGAGIIARHMRKQLQKE